MSAHSSIARVFQRASRSSTTVVGRLPIVSTQQPQGSLLLQRPFAASTMPSSRSFSSTPTDDNKETAATTTTTTEVSTDTVDTSTLLDAFRDPLSRNDRTESRVGRPWSATELRRKSFDDLHKLWFVLYKERNLLMTEQVLCRRNQVELLQPERLAKVQKSLGAIRHVLGERKRGRMANKRAELAERKLEGGGTVFDGDDDESTMDDFDDAGVEPLEKEEETQKV